MPRVLKDGVRLFLTFYNHFQSYFPREEPIDRQNYFFVVLLLEVFECLFQLVEGFIHFLLEFRIVHELIFLLFLVLQLVYLVLRLEVALASHRCFELPIHLIVFGWICKGAFSENIEGRAAHL